MRSERGQSSIEFLVVIMVVAALVAIAGVAIDSSGVTNRVTREMARALCIVRGGDCYRDKEPCVLTADGKSKKGGVKVLFVKLGAGMTVLVEQRSDGSVAITHTPEGELGVETSVGYSHAIDLGKLKGGVSAEVAASATAHLRYGKTWIAPNAAAADVLMRQLKDHDPALPPPTVTELAAGIKGSATATASAGASAEGAVAASDEKDDKNEKDDKKSVKGATLDLAAATAGIGGGVSVASRTDRATGHRTVYLAADASISGSVDLAGGALGAAGKGLFNKNFSIEYDKDGRPLSLAVATSGAYARVGDLPAVARTAGATLATAGKGGDRTFEVTARLDLTDPANRAAVDGLLGALKSPGKLAGAYGDLSGRIEQEGTVEARVLEGSSDSSGFSGSVALGVQLGLSYEKSTWDSHLVGAASRGLDGRWITREDCVEASIGA